MSDSVGSERILSELESLPPDGAAQGTDEVPKDRLFIFSVEDALFALPPETVREIIADLDIFPLPCCPPYVSGLINSHGLPYAAIDLRVLFESERHHAVKFLVLNRPGDAVAFGCTDVVEIAEIPSADISRFTQAEEETRYCSASFMYKGRRVMIIQPDSIMDKLAHDIA
jgi:chemotaxis signal transduction protein